MADVFKIDTTGNSYFQVLEKVDKCLRKGRMLFLWDDCDQFFENKEKEQGFYTYLLGFLTLNADLSFLITAVKPPSFTLKELTHHAHEVSKLHDADATLLFLKRLPRDLEMKKDSPDFEINNFASFGNHPIFSKLLGNPRLIELCASLLTHMTLREINFCLNVQMEEWSEKLSLYARDSLTTAWHLRQSLLGNPSYLP